MSYTIPSPERLAIRVAGQDHMIAARLHLAWIVEQTAQSLGLAERMADGNGDGPFIVAVRLSQRDCEAVYVVPGEPVDFPCGERATVVVADPYDGSPVYLCRDCAERGL